MAVPSVYGLPHTNLAPDSRMDVDPIMYKIVTTTHECVVGIIGGKIGVGLKLMTSSDCLSKT